MPFRRPHMVLPLSRLTQLCCCRGGGGRECSMEQVACSIQNCLPFPLHAHGEGLSSHVGIENLRDQEARWVRGHVLCLLGYPYWFQNIWGGGEEKETEVRLKKMTTLFEIPLKDLLNNCTLWKVAVSGKKTTGNCLYGHCGSPASFFSSHSMLNIPLIFPRDFLLFQS